MPVTDGHDVGNYRLGKGILSFKRTGAADFVDMGNVTELVIAPELETLEHFSSRLGVRAKDLEVVIEKKGTIQITMEEFNPHNIGLALLGAVGGTDDNEIDIFSESSITGELKWEAANDIGPKTSAEFYNVAFVNGGDFGFIEDEWGTMECEAQMLVASTGPNAGKFGKVTVDNYVAPDPTP